MKVYNAMTKKKEKFVPIEKNRVKMYACGITVSGDAHIGHARQAITYDVISQYLEYRGYEVTYVRNYTDVDDKIIEKANEEGINALAFAERKIKEIDKDLADLRVRDANIKTKATDYIGKIIGFVEKLIEKGYAYPTDKGDVYFAVDNFKGYGKLSNRHTEDMLFGVRKELEEEKGNPADFALWKAAKEGEIYWESPWGKGRPGWHIECSVMAMDTLGETIDIHGGGKDLLFPHHENEIAQNEALTGKQFANYWIHNGLVTLDVQKMSKSLGNTMTIREALDRYNPEVIKYAMLEKHYSSEIDLTEKIFRVAEKHLYYFYTILNKIDKITSKTAIECTSPANTLEEIEENFIKAMDDDFNTATAIADLFAIAKHANTLIDSKDIQIQEKAKRLHKLKSDITRLYSVLGIFQEYAKTFVDNLKSKHLKELGITHEEIEVAIDQRSKAKLSKNYALADKLRNMLDDKGVVLNDSKEGTEWDIKNLYSISMN